MYLVEGAGIDATQHWVIKKLLELYPKPPEPEPEEPQARKQPGQVGDEHFLSNFRVR